MSTKTKALVVLQCWCFYNILVISIVSADAEQSTLTEVPSESSVYSNVSAEWRLNKLGTVEKDTDVVEAATLPTPIMSTGRRSRQFLYDPSLLLLTNFGAEGSKCITSRGLSGVCVRFSACQQFYRAKRQLSFITYRQWSPAVAPALLFEPCSFYNQFGRANSGICCTSTFLGNGFGVLPPFLIPGAVNPVPSPPVVQPTPADDGSVDVAPPNEDEDVETIENDTEVTETVDAPNSSHSPEFSDENDVIYDPIKDDLDELTQRRTTPTTATTYNEFTYQWPGQFGSHFSGVWPPPVPTHPPSTAVWPPPIPTHPPNHHYPTHPPATGGSPASQVTTRRTTTTKITTRRPYVTKTTTRRPVTTTKRPLPTTTTTRRPSHPIYPGYPSYPSYPGYPTYRPPYTTTTTTSRPPVAVSPAGSTPVTLPAQCGVKNAVSPDQERIVGGSNASPHEFPWIVVLFKAGKQFCGGSLITNQHILTAAHCVARMTSWDVAALTAHLGDYNIRTDFEVQHVVRRIKRLVRHKGFDFSTLHNDIAILTVNEPLKFTREVQPICLPTSSTQQGRSYSGHLATVAGWGSLRENGPQPSILQKVQIPIWANTDCARKYGRAAPGGIIESMVCAGQAYKDSCSGDSGGPLVINEGGRFTQVGIVSWGIGCGKGEYPGVYTRITSLLPWIYKNIK